MKKGKVDVQHIAQLARLHLTPEEEKELQKHLDQMLEYVEILNEVDVSGVEPMAYPHEGSQRLRSDTPRPGINRNEALGIAPDEFFFLYRVPSPLKGVKDKS